MNRHLKLALRRHECSKWGRMTPMYAYTSSEDAMNFKLLLLPLPTFPEAEQQGDKIALPLGNNYKWRAKLIWDRQAEFYVIPWLEVSKWQVCLGFAQYEVMGYLVCDILKHWYSPCPFQTKAVVWWVWASSQKQKIVVFRVRWNLKLEFQYLNILELWL